MSAQHRRETHARAATSRAAQPIEVIELSDDDESPARKPAPKRSLDQAPAPAPKRQMAPPPRMPPPAEVQAAKVRDAASQLAAYLPTLCCVDAHFSARQISNWDCGYANAAAVCATMANNRAPSLAKGGVRGTFGASLRGGAGAREIQRLVEGAWLEGFDPQGARHYGRTLVGKTGKKGWLGAAECLVLLWHLRVEAFIVEIVHKAKAGAALYGVAKSCFESSTAEPELHAAASSGDSGGASSSSSSSRRDEVRTGCTDRAPLFLQWKGHSVSIVGVLPAPHERLIIRDPRDRTEQLRLLRPSEFDGDQYQIVVCGRPSARGGAERSAHAMSDGQAARRIGDDPDPAAVFMQDGKWAYSGWCHLRFW